MGERLINNPRISMNFITVENGDVPLGLVDDLKEAARHKKISKNESKF